MKHTKVRFSLRARLMAMLVAACAVVLGVACAAFVIYDRDSSGEAKRRTMTVLADTVAGSVAGAVAFGDGESARFVIEKFAAEETALSAEVVTADGARLASWARKDARLDGALHISRPVVSEGKEIGALRLEVSTRDLDERTQRFLLIALGIFLACTLLATLSSMWLHRFITAPVLELASTAADVQSKRDYSRRARVLSSDELGLLTHAFNEMLASIEQRDSELAEHRNNLARLVDERTAELRQRTHEMRLLFDTVEQGFVTIDATGVLANERSARFDQWFGVPSAGATIDSHFATRWPSFAPAFRVGWDQVIEGFMPLDVSIDMLPSRLSHGGRTWKLSYTPRCEGEKVLGALVSLSDITAEIEAERRQQSERELVAAISRLVADRVSFVDFLDETERLINSLDGSDPVLALRALHTIKGGASLFGVESVCDRCHHLEEQLQQGEVVANLGDAVREPWGAFRARVAPFLGGDDGRVYVTRAEVSALLHSLDAEGESQHAATLRDWLLEPVRPRLDLLAQRGKVLATRLGKAHAEFHVDAPEARVHREVTAPLWSVLVHLVRNALDHGIESEAERTSAGKQPTASLRFSAWRTARATHLRFSDDGRGIDWQRVAKKAGREGASRAELVDVLLSDGFSTREEATETSGRGVGLSAVAQVVRELGGTLNIESEPGAGCAFEITLPHQAVLRAAA